MAIDWGTNSASLQELLDFAEEHDLNVYPQQPSGFLENIMRTFWTPSFLERTIQGRINRLNLEAASQTMNEIRDEESQPEGEEYNPPTMIPYSPFGLGKTSSAKEVVKLAAAHIIKNAVGYGSSSYDDTGAYVPSGAVVSPGESPGGTIATPTGPTPEASDGVNQAIEGVVGGVFNDLVGNPAYGYNELVNIILPGDWWQETSGYTAPQQTGYEIVTPWTHDLFTGGFMIGDAGRAGAIAGMSDGLSAAEQKFVDNLRVAFGLKEAPASPTLGQRLLQARGPFQNHPSMTLNRSSAPGPWSSGLGLATAMQLAATAGPNIRADLYRPIDEARRDLNAKTNVFVSDEHAEYLGRKYGVDINNLSNTWHREDSVDAYGRAWNGWNLTPAQQSSLFSPIFDQEGVTATPHRGTSVANVVRDSGNYTEDESYMIRGLLREGAFPGLLGRWFPFMPGSGHIAPWVGDTNFLPYMEDYLNSNIDQEALRESAIRAGFDQKTEDTRMLPLYNPEDYNPEDWE